MNCTDIEKNHDRIEQYVTGALRGADRDRFEEHLLTCESCQKQLEELALLRTSLADERWAVAEESRGRRLEWHWSWAAAAAALLLGLGLVLWLAPWAGSPSNEALVAASMVEAPPYEPARLRSVTGAGELLFQEAMQDYLEGSYAKAIPGLESAVETDPELAKAHFYLGACYLLEDEPERAINNLSRVAEVEDQQYREWAHFYRARAYIRAGELEPAREDLFAVISMQGELQTQAQEVLEQITD